MKKASFALIMFAVFGSALVVWVPGLWSSLAFEVIGFALAASWLIAALPGRLELRGSLALVPLAAAVVWGLTQGGSGTTVYPWKTQISVLYWAANAAFLFVALQVWNELCRRKLLPFETLNPESGQVVTDGSFSKPPMKEGFGWTLLRETGASVSLGETGTGVAIRFGGKQAERTGLLLQRVPLVGRRHYRFTYEYRVAGNAGPTGIHWELLALPQDGDALHGEATLQATDWTTASQEFESPGTAAPRLMLFYQRKLGMLPWEGVVYVRKVSIEALP